MLVYLFIIHVLPFCHFCNCLFLFVIYGDGHFVQQEFGDRVLRPYFLWKNKCGSSRRLPFDALRIPDYVAKPLKLWPRRSLGVGPYWQATGNIFVWSSHTNCRVGQGLLVSVYVHDPICVIARVFLVITACPPITTLDVACFVAHACYDVHASTVVESSLLLPCLDTLRATS